MLLLCQHSLPLSLLELINFSLKYPRVIQQTGNGKTQTYQIVILILQQTIVTNIKGNV